MKLTRIRLINWHIFSDNTIDFSGNLLVTGENGNGKSTLIDAIFFVLSGGEERCFNSAANNESTRTLKSYLQCKIGTEGKENIREESNIVCHIALEFFDEAEHKSHILGTIIEIIESSKPRFHFYIMNNRNLQSLNFFDSEKQIIDYYVFKREYKNEFYELKNTLSGRRTDIAIFFKLSNGNKYYNLLKKAIAFKPLNEDVSGFVNSFLLNEDNINVVSLQEELKSYHSISQTIDREQKKLDCLNAFIDKTDRYLKNQKEIGFLKIIQCEETEDKIKDNIDKNKHKIKESIEKVEELARKEKTIEADLSDYRKQRESLEENDIYKALKVKQDRLNVAEGELTKYNQAIKDIEDKLRKELPVIKMFDLIYNFSADIKNRNIALLNSHIRNYCEEIDSIRDKLAIENAKMQQKLTDTGNSITQIYKEIDEINRGKNNYDGKVTELIRLIKQHVKDDKGKTIDVLPLCECIEIVEKEWTDAIEGYLNSQRFDLIINPSFFDSALKIYEKYKSENKIYGIGIVNSDGDFNVNVEKDSLYSKIKVINPYAEGICKQILGRVIGVDNVTELKKYKTAITKTCMVYKNSTARNIDPKIFEKPFIGKDSVIKRKELLRTQLNDLTEQKNDVNREIGILKGKTDTIKLSKLYDDAIQDYWAQEEDCNQIIEVLKAEIKSENKNPNILYIQDSIEKLRKKMIDLSEKEIQIRDKIYELNKEQGGLQSQIDSSNLSLQAKVNEKNDLISNLKDENEFYSFKREYNSCQMSVEEQIYKRVNSNNANRGVIQSGMNEYSSTYNKNLSPDLNCGEDFIAEYNRISNSDIVSLKAQADNAYKNALNSFNENFIRKLQEKLKNAKDEIDAINKNLKKHPFGREEEVYQFIIKESFDMEMREYARIIMSGKDIEQKDLFTETLDRKDMATMQELFNKIASGDNATSAEKSLAKYLDYREYRQYDIQIKNCRDEISYFSKIHKDKNGGETQTPFYVIIGSCFEELIKKDEKKFSACIVVFDEAFNNMDEPRIITLMNFYKELNIQLLIVVPTNRAYALIPYVDTAVALRKINYAVCETYIKNNG